MALSAKASESLIIVLDKMEIEKPKTKEMAGLLKLLRSKIKNLDQGSALIILSEKDKNVFLSARNIPALKTMEAKNMNVLDLLSFKYLIMSKPSIKVIQETFLK